MKMYLLPEDLRTALMEYLRGQPYGAVESGMKALEGLREAVEPVPALVPEMASRQNVDAIKQRFAPVHEELPHEVNKG